MAFRTTTVGCATHIFFRRRRLSRFRLATDSQHLRIVDTALYDGVTTLTSGANVMAIWSCVRFYRRHAGHRTRSAMRSPFVYGELRIEL
jgi:hypothetical protein